MTNPCNFNIFLGLAREPNSAPVIMYTSGKAGLSASEMTWPKILQNSGYYTQAVGMKEFEFKYIF